MSHPLYNPNAYGNQRSSQSPYDLSNIRTERDPLGASASLGPGSSLSSSGASSHRHNMDSQSGNGSLDWILNYKRRAADDSPPALSSSASGNDSKPSTTNKRKRDVKSIPGLGDYDDPVANKPAASTESNRLKHTSETAANILLKFGLEKEDLQYLTSYRGDQITPANLPFILRQIRLQKEIKKTQAAQEAESEHRSSTSKSQPAHNPFGGVQPSHPGLVLRSVPPFPLHSANPYPMVIPPVPYQPTTGLITYNHLAYLTSNTQFSANLAVSKDQPTQAMINDYAATVPKLFPHTCSLCNTQCTNMQDWISHQNASFHLENCKQLCKTYPKWDGGIGSRSRHESPSPSKSSNSSRRRDSDDRRDRRRSRSRSDLRSRHHRRSRAWSRSRSRSPSPRNSSRISSRYRSDSRSSDRQSSSRRSDRRESTPRRSRERRLPPRRKRERRSPTKDLSSERERESSAEKLARKLMETSGFQSLSNQSDREVVINTLAPALILELAKMKSSASGRGQKRSSSPLSAGGKRPSSTAGDKDAEPVKVGINAGSKERTTIEPVLEHRADEHGASKPSTGSAEHASETARNARAEEASAGRHPGSSTAVTPPTAGEMVEKLLDPMQIRFLSVKTCFNPKFLKCGNRQLLISKLPKYNDGFYEEEDVARLLFPFGFCYTDSNIFVLPQVCLAFVLMPTPERVCDVLQSVSRLRFNLKGTELWVNVVSEKQMMSPLGLYMKLMELMKSPVSDEGAVIYIIKIPPREAEELREAMRNISFKNFLPFLNKVFIEFESHYDADQFGHWYCHLHPGRSQNICKLDENKCPVIPTSRKKMDGASGVDAQKAGSNPRAVTTKETAALATQPAAARKTKQKMKASICYSADGTPLTRGEMVEHYLCKERVGCLPEKFCISPQFLVRGSKLMLLTELPAFDVYTEADVAKVLAPFGFQFKDDNIYVVPQARMAFIRMETAEKVQQLMKTYKEHPLVLLEAKLCLHVVTSCPDTTHLDFYKFLMGLMKHRVTDEGGRTVLIRNISQSEIEDLRATLKKIGSVRNILPLLNKVFIEFDSVRDADRLGVWYSFQKHAAGHLVQRLKVPRSGCTSLAPRLPSDALPDNKDVIEGATIPPEDTVVPQGSTPPFWVTLRNSPYMFPTTSPWFIIPRFLTVKTMGDITRARGSTTIMLTSLPSGYYNHDDVARLVWPYFSHQTLLSLYYNVVVLPLQKRAFVFFMDEEACSRFLQDYMARPIFVKERAVKVHIVLDHMTPQSSEETMYKSLMRWSNAGVPDPDSLEERLLCARITEVSVQLIFVVLEVVASVAPFVNFLPLANRICIEMADPSGVTKVLEKRNSLCPITNEKRKAWKKVLGFETVKNLKQRLQASSKTTTVKRINAKVDTTLQASDTPTQRPPSEPLDSGSQSALPTNNADGSTVSEPIAAGPSSTVQGDEAKTKEGEKPGTEVAMDSTAGSNSNEDGKKIVEEGSPTTSVSTAEATSASAVSSPDLSATALTSEEDLAEFSKVDAESLHTLSAAVRIHELCRVSRSNNMDGQHVNDEDVVTVHDVEDTSHEPHRSSNSSSQSKKSTKPTESSASGSSSSSPPPAVTEAPSSWDKIEQQSVTTSTVQSSNTTSSPRTGSPSSAQERENIKSKGTVDASMETDPEQLTESAVATSAHKLSAEGAAAKTAESETGMETTVMMKRNKEEGKKGVEETDEQMGDGEQDTSSKIQTTGPKESQTLHQESLQILDSIDDEPKAQTEVNSVMEMDGSLQGQEATGQEDSPMVQDGGSIVKQLSEGDDKPEVDKSNDEEDVEKAELKEEEEEEVKGEMISNVSCKASEDAENQVNTTQERSDRRGKKEENTSINLKEASEKPDTVEEATVQVLDAVEGETFNNGPTIATRTTRGRRERTQIDAPIDQTTEPTKGRRTPARESQSCQKAPPTKKSASEVDGTSEEVSTFETLDSVEVEVIKDDGPRTRAKGKRGRPKKANVTTNREEAAATMIENLPESRSPSQEDESVNVSNPKTLVTLDDAGGDEEEKTDENQAVKPSRPAELKHDDVSEESFNFVTVDKAGEEEVKEVVTPRRRGRARRSRLTPVRKSLRGKPVSSQEEKEEEELPPSSLDASSSSSSLDKDSSNQSNDVHEEVEAASQADINAASAGPELLLENKTLEGCAEEEEGEEEEEDSERSRADSKALNKSRRELHGPEAERSQSPSDFKLPEFKPNNPLGQEFVVPKSRYYCKLCSVSYLNERAANELHCSSQEHYDNLQKYFQELEDKSQRSSQSYQDSASD